MTDPARHRVPVAFLGVAALWIGLVVVFIAREPKPGATSVRALADQYQAAVTGNRPDELAQLIDYPGLGPDFAKDIISQLSDAGAGGIAVQPSTTPSGRPALEVSGRLRGGQAFTYLLSIAQNGERWVIKPLPPV